MGVQTYNHLEAETHTDSYKFEIFIEGLLRINCLEIKRASKKEAVIRIGEITHLDENEHYIKDYGDSVLKGILPKISF